MTSFSSLTFNVQEPEGEIVNAYCENGSKRKPGKEQSGLTHFNLKNIRLSD